MPTKAAQPQVDWSTAQPIQSNQVDWGSAQPIDKPSAPVEQPGLIQQAQNYFDQLTRIDPHQMPHSLKDVGREGVRALGNVGAGALSIATPLVHPVKTLAGIGGLLPPVAAYDDISHHFNPQHPQSVYSDIAQGLVEHPLESGEQFVGQMAGGEALGAAGRGIKRAADPLKDYRSPAISPKEAVGRRTADILKVNPAAYRNVFSSVAEHAPYIKDFAESTGNKFKTPLDFSKAATGAGQESSNFFKENLIEPNAELRTPHGTIAEVHQRLGDINDELRPAYRQRTGGQELTALERKALENERDQLNNTLYETLSERSGLPSERIQGINQRGGALQNVGDEADAAQAMRRAGFSGYTPTGLPIPMGMMDHIGRLAQYLRGGPEAVAGRQLSRVFKNVGPPTEGLPDPMAINNYRRMAEQSDLGNMQRGMATREANQQLANARKPFGMGPTKARPNVFEPDAEGAMDVTSARRTPRILASAERQNAARAAQQAEMARRAANWATRGKRLQAPTE